MLVEKLEQARKGLEVKIIGKDVRKDDFISSVSAIEILENISNDEKLTNRINKVKNGVRELNDADLCFIDKHLIDLTQYELEAMNITNRDLITEVFKI